MIEHFTDHAANERTYLAWIRTSIALIGLGFVIERFDIFLKSPVLVGTVSSGRFAALTGLLLMLGGVLVLVVSTVRYVQFRNRISSPKRDPYASPATEWLLVGVVSLVGLLVIAYFVSQLDFFSGTLSVTGRPSPG